jgi:hypothetical protein
MDLQTLEFATKILVLKNDCRLSEKKKKRENIFLN